MYNNKSGLRPALLLVELLYVRVSIICQEPFLPRHLEMFSEEEKIGINPAMLLMMYSIGLFPQVFDQCHSTRVYRAPTRNICTYNYYISMSVVYIYKDTSSLPTWSNSDGFHERET